MRGPLASLVFRKEGTAAAAAAASTLFVIVSGDSTSLKESTTTITPSQNESVGATANPPSALLLPHKAIFQRPPSYCEGTTRDTKNETPAFLAKDEPHTLRVDPQSNAPTKQAWRWWESFGYHFSGITTTIHNNLPRPLRSHDARLALTRIQRDDRARDEAVAQSILEQLATVFTTMPRDEKIEQHQQPPNPTTRRQQQQQQLNETVGALQKQWLDTVYGPGVTLADRQAFVERYGCTGWTDAVLDRILEIGECPSNSTCVATKVENWGTKKRSSRGFVEIGAGNGQWARALTDRYKLQQLQLKQTEQSPTRIQRSHPKLFDLVLAYDNFTRVPLNAKVYHGKTKVAASFFYPNVQPLVGSSIATTIQQWSCRNRILLLVFPPPESNMAVDSIRAYDKVHSCNAMMKRQRHTHNLTTTATSLESTAHDNDDVDASTGSSSSSGSGSHSPHWKPTMVYVGEGRGGANANDAFFDYMEDPANAWILVQVMEVQKFGSKGYEGLFIFEKEQ